MWEEDKKPLLEWLALQRFILDFWGDPPGHHRVTDCGCSWPGKANSASECSQALAMTVCPAALCTGSLAHFDLWQLTLVWTILGGHLAVCTPLGPSSLGGWERWPHNMGYCEPLGCRTWECSQPHQRCCGLLIPVCGLIPRITQQLLLAHRFSHLWGLRIPSTRANLCIYIALQLSVLYRVH